VALRAPEVVLGSSFDYRIDIWSFGCYLNEIFTGRPLFDLVPCNPVRLGKQCEGNNHLLQDDDHDHLHPSDDQFRDQYSRTASFGNVREVAS